MRTAYDVLKDTAAVKKFPIADAGGWATLDLPKLGHEQVSVAHAKTVFT